MSTLTTGQLDIAKANLSASSRDETPPSSQRTVPFNSISLPAEQPRRYFDSEKMKQLVQSVKRHGIMQPLIVRQLNDQDERYELIAGERRYRAAKVAQLEEVLVTIYYNLTNEEAFRLSLTENLLRKDLNPFEETQGILRLLVNELDLPEKEVKTLLYQMERAAKEKRPATQNVLGSEKAQKIQVLFEEVCQISWQSFVTSRLPLLRVPTNVLEALQAGEIEYTKAIAIAKVKDQRERQALLAKAIASNLSLSQIKEKIKELTDGKSKQVLPKSGKRMKASIESLVKNFVEKLEKNIFEDNKFGDDQNRRERAKLLLQQLKSIESALPELIDFVDAE